LRGDDVSRTSMMLHAPLTLVAVALIGPGFMVSPALLWGAICIFALLAAERGAAAVRAWRRFGNRTALHFIPVHLLRDLAWTAAILVWLARRMLRRPRRPGHSMA